MNISIFKDYKGLPKSVYILFIANIINTLGAFVFPFLTLFLTEKLNMSPSLAGRFILFYSLLSIPGSLIGGKLADLYGRKNTLLFFNFISASIFMICGFLEQSIYIAYLLVLSGFFSSAVRPCINAIVGDITNKEERPQAFSLMYLGINIGYGIAPIVAGFLYSKYTKLLFIGDAFSTFLSLALIFFMIKETIPDKVNDTVELALDKVDLERYEEGTLTQVLFNRPYLIIFSLISAMFSFGYAQTMYILPMHMTHLFGDYGAKLYGISTSVNAILVVVGTAFILSLTKKNSPLYNITIAGIFFAIGFGMLYFANSFIIFILSTIIWTIGEILQSTNTNVYLTSHTPKSHRGRFNSVISLVSHSGFTFGPFIMGFIISKDNIAIGWPIVFLVCFLGCILMYKLYIWDRKKIQGTS